jgi:hypothetical protein
LTDATVNLESLVAELPDEKAREVFDFAAYLHRQYAQQPGRGSARAILRALGEGGPLEFDDGELDALLAELEALRQLDVADHV